MWLVRLAPLFVLLVWLVRQVPLLVLQVWLVGLIPLVLLVPLVPHLTASGKEVMGKVLRVTAHVHSSAIGC